MKCYIHVKYEYIISYKICYVFIILYFEGFFMFLILSKNNKLLLPRHIKV